MHRALSPTTIRIPVGDQPGCPCSICEERSLRDRIAAAIKSADKRVAGFITYEERADAVIRELRSSGGVDLTHNHAYPRDYTDRQLLESVWRKIDGLAEMVAGPTRMYPDAHPDDIAEVVAAWTPTHNNEETP